ncbi:ROK family transcriptional regulator [Motilibacter sp. E257]|uniref:ROK family transcriptional regulator n=1 Tax=Motilibacter deserti TaxID=2714956 RepID=A0ABX0GQN3_9ACTN|nr:ROK family transcriptional regulator [Motilibacter deserti]
MGGRALALLQAVHADPGLTRADAARRLGFGTGAVTELVGRLVADRLLAEAPAPPSGSRGRPTRHLVAHPHGPVVLAASITHESWRLDAVELGGATLATVAEPHAGRVDEVLHALSRAVGELRSRFHDRVRGLGVAAPGTVLQGRYLDAAILDWHGVDLHEVWPEAEVLVVDNDTTLAALAEGRRGAAVDAALAVHVRVEAGLGGAVLEAGRVVRGARGVAGEFGHMPFGDPQLACPCGARGCWGIAVDGTALARLLHAPPPANPITYGQRVLRRARSGDAGALDAAQDVADTLGRGIAGLVNALDPDLVILDGLATDLLEAAPEALRAAYVAGLMAFRRDAPPRLVPAELREAGPLVGAAEQVWSALWSRL